MPIFRLEIENRPHVPDALGTMTERQLANWLGLRPARVRTRKLFLCDLDIDEKEAQRVLDAITDPVIEISTLGVLPDDADVGTPWILTVSFAPGVTDTVGKTAKTAAEDVLGRTLTGRLLGERLGGWQWIGTRTLVFRPTTRFPMATSRAGSVPARSMLSVSTPTPAWASRARVRIRDLISMASSWMPSEGATASRGPHGRWRVMRMAEPTGAMETRPA